MSHSSAAPEPPEISTACKQCRTTWNINIIGVIIVFADMCACKDQPQSITVAAKQKSSSFLITFPHQLFHQVTADASLASICEFGGLDAVMWATFPTTQGRQLREDGWRPGGDARWKTAGGIQSLHSKDIQSHFNQTKKQGWVPSWESEGKCANYHGS